MYVFILVLVPLLFLFNPYLAMAALIAAIAGMYGQRTRTSSRARPRPPAESAYKPGYED